AGLLLGFLERDFGVAQVFLGVLHLLLEEEAALRGFADSKMLGDLAQLVHVGVGHSGGALGIFVLDRDADQSFFFGEDVTVGGQILAGVGGAFVSINPHQVELGKQGV